MGQSKQAAAGFDWAQIGAAFPNNVESPLN
jgi:hypothetical protein